MKKEEIRSFLSTIFGDMPEGYYFQIWTLKDKKTAWFQTPDAAADYITTRCSGDVYFGVGITKTPTCKGRGTKENINGIMGVHFDIDYDCGGHKKNNLPPTITDAMSLIEDFGTRPSAIINSGGGLQAYYLFKEPLLFDTPEDREAAESFIRNAHETLKGHAVVKKWTLDSVFDITRVMRVPGTPNTKYGADTYAKIIYADGPRYNIEDLQQFITATTISETIELTDPQDPTTTEAVEGTVYNPSAVAPPLKLDTLLDVDTEFKQTWRKARDHEFPSASEYDWSIIAKTAHNGFTVQECIDTVIEWRRRHNESPEKIARKDYRRRLAIKALGIIKEKASDQAEEFIVDEIVATGTPVQHGADTAAVLDAVSKRLNFTIQEFRIYLEDPPQYEIKTDVGDIFLGPSGNLVNQSEFRKKVLDAIRVMPKIIKGKKEVQGSGWDGIVQSLVNAAVEIEVSEESTVNGETVAFLQSYLENRPKAMDIEVEFTSNNPIWLSDEWHISIDDFAAYIKSMGSRINTRKELARRLKWIGAYRKQTTQTIAGKVVHRRFWVIPNKIFN